MRVNAFPIASQLREFLLHRLLLVEPGLPCVEERRADQHVRHLEIPLDESEGAIAVQRGTDKRRGSGIAIEQHVFPGDEDVVENYQRVDFVEAIREWIIFGWRAAGEASAADKFQSWRSQVADEAQSIIRQLGVSPVRDGRF